MPLRRPFLRSGFCCAMATANDPEGACPPAVDRGDFPNRWPVRCWALPSLFFTCMVAAGTVLALEAPEQGGWSLSAGDDRLSLWTQDAPLGDVLRGLQDATPAPLRFGPVPETNVTVRYRNKSLDELLGHLNVSYFITYHRQ